MEIVKEKSTLQQNHNALISKDHLKYWGFFLPFSPSLFHRLLNRRPIVYEMVLGNYSYRAGSDGMNITGD